MFSEENRQSFGCVAFYVLVTLLSMLIRWYNQWYCERMVNDRTNESHHGNVEDLENEPQRNLEEKYRDIESSLVSMFVIEHDDTICCHHQVPVIESSVSQNNKLLPPDEEMLPESRNDDVDDVEEPEGNKHHIVCSICLDPFHVNDIVSISPKKQSSCDRCHHVFHHVCIKEWLLHHVTCPSCRQEFFDRKHIHDTNQETSSDDNDCNDNQCHETISTSNEPTDSNLNHHNQHFVCCVQHGIMIVTTTNNPTTTDRVMIPDSPKQQELMLLRVHPTKTILDEQCHNESHANAATISISSGDEVEESDATLQETHHSDDTIDV